jgi:hypothetical protein
MEYWNGGVREYWNSGAKSTLQNSTTPVLHYSTGWIVDRIMINNLNTN